MDTPASAGPSSSAESSVRLQPFGGVRVVGEVDLAARPDWSATLASLGAQDRDIHLDMADLTFIDTRATAELVELARALPAGRTITLCQPPRVLRRVIDVMWSDARLPIRVLS